MKQWIMVNAPFEIDGRIEQCRLLSKEQHYEMWKRNMSASVWDNDECEVFVVQREISEYEVEETFYIYFYEDAED